MINKGGSNIAFVYGSLRVGHGNGAWANDLERVIARQVPIKGYKLYGFGGYPGINRSDNEEDILYVDIIDYDDSTFQSVESMELGAGYDSVTITVNHNGVDYTGQIYIYRRPLENSHYPLVENGDWNSFRTPRFPEHIALVDKYIAERNENKEGILSSTEVQAPVTQTVEEESGVEVAD